MWAGPDLLRTGLSGLGVSPMEPLAPWTACRVIPHLGLQPGTVDWEA